MNLDIPPLPTACHKVVARLVLKYCGDGARVLDFGCGLGQVSVLVKKTRPSTRIFACDSNEQCLQITGKLTEVEMSYLLPEAEFNLEPIKVRDYDCVVASHVLEHLRDPVGVVHQFLQLVRPGGYLILAVPNPVRPQVMLSALLQIHYVNRGHVASWDRSHWVNFLESILELQVCEYAGDKVLLPLIPHRVRSRVGPIARFEELLVKLVPWWSSSNIAVIRKPD